MKTTVELDDDLLRRSKETALREGLSLRALIEEGLRQLLARRGRRDPQGTVELPICSREGGLLAGVDLNDSADLEDRMGN